jgi:5'-nucleotidase
MCCERFIPFLSAGLVFEKTVTRGKMSDIYIAKDPMQKPQILLTNDDGIRSPGLWAAAAALSQIGYVHVAAPRDQYSGAGRSLPYTSDGVIQVKQMNVNGQDWTVYAVGGTPAQVVLHSVLEILPERPDLVVSGINYGENVGSGITVSGTVGAAMEAASMGIPSLAVSLETDVEHHLSYSTDVDFSAAAHFTALFGRMLLERRLLPDVELLKVDVPSSATLQTGWKMTRVSKTSYFEPVAPVRSSWSDPGRVGYRLNQSPQDEPQDTDIYVLRVLRQVSVTPLSLDMSSRVSLKELDKLLRNGNADG